ncbi:MAG: DUF6134 family protein, partial [Oceanospirillum sp.]|nr:DUF6134 family protein [Oceanospirillum sp.]
MNSRKVPTASLSGKRILLSTVTAAILTLSGSLQAAEKQLKPQAAFHSLSHWQRLYGVGLEFSVTRNEKPVGSYEVIFKGSESDWQVESRMALDFKAFLFFSYRFR